MVAVLPSESPLRTGSKHDAPTSSAGSTIAILQPHPIMRDGLVRTVSTLVPGAAVYGYGSASVLLEQSSGGCFRLIITELNLRAPDCSLSSLEQLRKRLPHAEILILSPLSEQQFGLAALRGGANAFLSFGVSLEELGEAIRALLAGSGYISSEMAAVVADEAQGRGPRNGFSKLSPRELDVIRHLIWGMQLKTVASTLGLNIRTASCYKKNALGKLGMSSVAEVVRYSSEQGLTV